MSMKHASGPIVVGVDGSEPSRIALEWAAREAALRQRPLRILHAFLWPATDAYLGPSPAGPPDGGLRNLAEELLADAATQARSAAPGIEVSTELAVCAPAARLVEESREAAMIVVGSRGLGGFSGLVLGSVGVQVSTHAHCPVVVVREGGPGEVLGPVAGQVVAGVDGSAATEATLRFAFEAASMRGAGLTVMHAWTAPISTGPSDVLPLVYDVDAVNEDEGRLLAEVLAGWQEKYPDVPVRRLLLHRPPAKELMRLSHGAQMLVLGARGRGGFRGLLLGSVSQAAIQHASCPVAVVRAQP
jgi:nucleotide-binding universal stress UspA family protein